MEQGAEPCSGQAKGESSKRLAHTTVPALFAPILFQALATLFQAGSRPRTLFQAIDACAEAFEALRRECWNVHPGRRAAAGVCLGGASSMSWLRLGSAKPAEAPAGAIKRTPRLCGLLSRGVCAAAWVSVEGAPGGCGMCHQNPCVTTCVTRGW